MRVSGNAKAHLSASFIGLAFRVSSGNSGTPVLNFITFGKLIGIRTYHPNNWLVFGYAIINISFREVTSASRLNAIKALNHPF